MKKLTRSIWYLLLLVLSSSAVARADASEDETAATMVRQAAKAASTVRRSNYESAVKLYKAALEKAVASHDVESELECLTRLGELYKKLLVPDQSIVFSKRALELSQKTKDQHNEAFVLNELGSAYSAIGQYENSLNAHFRSLKIYRSENDTTSVGSVATNIGICYLRMNQLQRAYDFYAFGLSLRRQTKDKVGEAYSLGNIGTLFQNAGQANTALKYYFESLRVCPRNEANVRVRSLTNVGFVFSEMGKFGDAIHYLTKAVDEAQILPSPEVAAFAENNLGLAYTGRDDYPDAKIHFENALSIWKRYESKFGKAYTLTNYAALYIKMGEMTKALPLLDEALDLRNTIQDLRGTAITLCHRAHVKAALSDNGGARIDYEKAIEAVNRLLLSTQIDDIKRSTAESYQFIFASYIEFLIAQHSDPDNIRALEVSEMSRARALRDLIFAKTITPSDLRGQRETSAVGTGAVEMAEAAAIREISGARAVPSLMSSENLPDTFGLPDSSWRFLDSMPPTLSPDSMSSISWQTIRENANKGPFVIYHVMPTGVAIFFVSRSGSLHVAFSPILASDLNRLLSNVTTSLQLNTGSPVEKLRRLYQLLVQPVENWMEPGQGKASRPLVLIPYGKLFSVPFAALIATDGRYLIERVTLRVCPSLTICSVAAKKRSHSRTSGKAALFGDPQMPKGWDALPHSEREVNSVGALLAKRRFSVDVSKKKRASELYFRQLFAQADIIHVATHGFFDSKRPLYSGFVLASNTEGRKAARYDSDGFVTARELLMLNSGSRLLVLSTCDSGIGNTGADGVFGLQTAIMATGTASFVTALWAIDDRATAKFMKEFYGGIYNSKELRADVALQRAQIQLIHSKRFSSPTHWAAFCVVGIQ